MAEQETILIIDDDPEMVQLVKINCTELGYRVESVPDGAVGLEKAKANKYCLVILDVGLPGLGGFEVCQQLRQTKPGIPILMLTSRIEQVDRVLGLELGADDYVTKPFGNRELAARIKALLRRVNYAASVKENQPSEPTQIDCGDLKIDLQFRVVTLSGVKLELTVLEFNVLTYLASHPGRPFSREELMEDVWGYSSSQFDQSVTKVVGRLREKVEKNVALPRYIKTVRGIGYRFATVEELKAQSIVAGE